MTPTFSDNNIPSIGNLVHKNSLYSDYSVPTGQTFAVFAVTVRLTLCCHVLIVIVINALHNGPLIALSVEWSLDNQLTHGTCWANLPMSLLVIFYLLSFKLELVALTLHFKGHWNGDMHHIDRNFVVCLYGFP
jgi:hypothetical protein